MTHEAIAEHLTAELAKWSPPQKGIKARRVSQIIAKALDTMAKSDTETVELIRAQQVARINRLIMGLWPKATDPAHKEHLRAVREVARLELLRARLTGTEAARQVEHSGSVDVELFNPAEIERTEQAWLASGSTDDAPGVIEGTARERPALPAGAPA
jgi:hypothetical protein